MRRILRWSFRVSRSAVLNTNAGGRGHTLHLIVTKDQWREEYPIAWPQQWGYEEVDVHNHLRYTRFVEESRCNGVWISRNRVY